jgi:hypothetical protein
MNHAGPLPLGASAGALSSTGSGLGVGAGLVGCGAACALLAPVAPWEPGEMASARCRRRRITETPAMPSRLVALRESAAATEAHRRMLRATTCWLCYCFAGSARWPLKGGAGDQPRLGR